MANFFYITVDTVGPANPTASIESGAQYTTKQLVNVSIGTTDASTVGYQMKIWGDVDKANDPDIQDTEATSNWISYTPTKQIKLTPGDATKVVNIRLRDDVLNESAVATDDIKLSATLPNVTSVASDVRVSKKTTKDGYTFTFSADKPFVEYAVKVVANASSAQNTGTTIPTTNGSVNTSGTAGNYDTSTTPISVTIKTLDLLLASTGDGPKGIRVFVKDAAGNWSA
ncbi:hypothetical protein SHANETTE_216 [Bacillus phage Shanette]|uniref:Uncharacterized protein n=2 Tax=Siminovitchvirus TaxID=1918721 RepID=S5MMF0_9CAUD|nr:hypothetical protein AVV47_gp080 [Bacillus phage JL]YP_009216211.1 hypothetical protein AVV46_gp081 [Bacillus phage Shanette]AGR46880.1 hypothetical protein JL_216 [Bacillus phage JL]AGR47105.1 hypothetical protein SHANETTE_216 [Bacillus phage Shanette]